ncbi:phosphatidylinositol-3-phosphatase SAC1-A [Lepeophtheirus salmonis]|uniref:phosphatidylinositol-3-phosphatase SAC1-A n=1 Tax=Lepeophtheirus salmonis TaxID=72036 RepID=UPI001AE7F34C|nr:phosphatidylinositol-3-phosphatase SAC1-A-like [Lepeophtheirus salmonis]
MPFPRYRIFSTSQHIVITCNLGEDILLVDVETGDCHITYSQPKSSTYLTSAHVIVGLSPDKGSLILGTHGSVISSSSPLIEKVDQFLILDLKSSGKEDLRRRLLTSVLKTPHFYYSFEVDLTRPHLKKVESPLDFYSCSDKRYVWNDVHLESMATQNSSESLHLFRVPLIHGAVFTFKTPICNTNLKWILISRRSNERVGTRFFTRGIDRYGHVANHVETEQIIRMENRFESSFLQTRGSIPLLWHQTPDIRYMPQPWLCDAKENPSILAKIHFNEQMKLYGGALTCINLINQNKGEGRMEKAFAKVIKEVEFDDSSLHYVAFDFHSECKKSKGGWAQLYKLIRLLKEDFDKYGYYIKVHEQEEEDQKGVFRTNCMDCLDRTNVVQSLLATEHINSVLKRTKVFDKHDSILNYSTFQSLYKNAWADHANLISIQYSGTGALKTDFTRTGVRTKWGMLQDGWNSLNRYALNNFSDGFRTDALNYFVGHLPLHSIQMSHTKQKSSSHSPIKMLPSILKGFLSLFILLLVVLSPEDNKPIIALLSLILTLLVWIFKLNGPTFINYPTDYDLRASPPLQPKRKKVLDWFN